MKRMKLQGAARGKIKRTTIAGHKAISSEDFVNRLFNAKTPNSLWAADFTYVPTWNWLVLCGTDNGRLCQTHHWAQCIKEDEQTNGNSCI